jgi:hypothetical protein
MVKNAPLKLIPATEAVLDPADQFVDVLGARHVGRHRQDPFTGGIELLRRGVDLLGAATGEDHIGPELDKLPRGGETDTAPTAGNEDGFAVEFSHAASLTPADLRCISRIAGSCAQ